MSHFSLFQQSVRPSALSNKPGCQWCGFRCLLLSDRLRAGRTEYYLSRCEGLDNETECYQDANFVVTGSTGCCNCSFDNLRSHHDDSWFSVYCVMGHILIQWHDVVARLSASDSAVFIWKLRFHWTNCFVTLTCRSSKDFILSISMVWVHRNINQNVHCIYFGKIVRISKSRDYSSHLKL